MAPPQPPRLLRATPDADLVEWKAGDANRSLEAVFRVETKNPAVFWLRYNNTSTEDSQEKGDGGEREGRKERDDDVLEEGSTAESAPKDASPEISVSLSSLIYTHARPRMNDDDDLLPVDEEALAGSATSASRFSMPSASLPATLPAADDDAEATFMALVNSEAFRVFRPKDSPRIQVQRLFGSELEALNVSRQDDVAGNGPGSVDVGNVGAGMAGAGSTGVVISGAGTAGTDTASSLRRGENPRSRPSRLSPRHDGTKPGHFET